MEWPCRVLFYFHHTIFNRVFHKCTRCSVQGAARCSWFTISCTAPHVEPVSARGGAGTSVWEPVSPLHAERSHWSSPATNQRPARRAGNTAPYTCSMYTAKAARGRVCARAPTGECTGQGASTEQRITAAWLSIWFYLFIVPWMICGVAPQLPAAGTSLVFPCVTSRWLSPRLCIVMPVEHLVLHAAARVLSGKPLVTHTEVKAALLWLFFEFMELGLQHCWFPLLSKPADCFLVKSIIHLVSQQHNICRL